jgi:hypothetical protein
VQPSPRRRHGSPEEEEREAGDDDDDDDSSPIEQVALTVPVGDDPATPVLTFRMWMLGTASCAGLSFLNAFFGYRKEPLTITAVSAQIAVLPLGRLMAAALPEGAFFRGRPWAFTLNPGPFNMKEHVLITIFANAGAGAVFGMNLVTSVRVFYGQHMSFFVALLLILTSQVSEVNVIYSKQAGACMNWVCVPHRALGAGVWLGGNIPAVSGGAGGDVVALQPRAGLPLQVYSTNLQK